MKNLNVALNTHDVTAQPLSKTPQVLVAFLLLACLTVAFTPSARAADLVKNGDFEHTSNGLVCGLQYCTTADYWTSTGYAFLFAPGTADTTGSGLYANGPFLTLWGPLPATSRVGGGNYLAADGAYEAYPISQQIDNLTKNAKYTIGFWWAGAQQHNYYGANTEQWLVSFGSQTQATPILSNASEGFTGWRYQTFTFTADNTSDLLSFVASGTPPSGGPPFVLLDGVSVNAVPEPGTLLLAASGLLGLGSWRSWLRKR